MALQTLLGTDDVAVTMTAVHYCVKARGVKDGNSSTRTTSLGGVFKTDPASRAEFFGLSLFTLNQACSIVRSGSLDS